MRPRDDITTSDGEPHDRLTRLANEVLDAVKDHPEYEEGIRAIAFVTHNDRSGIGLHGYSDPKEAVVDLIIHLRAMFAVMGKELRIGKVVDNPDLS